MKKFTVVILALLLCLMLAACAQSEPSGNPTTVPTQAESTEASVENGTEPTIVEEETLNGCVITTYKDAQGTPIRQIVLREDGSTEESIYDENGICTQRISEGADGTYIEDHLYPDGQVKIRFHRTPDGAFGEYHYLDNGVANGGYFEGQTCIYSKYITADGMENEAAYEENGNIIFFAQKFPDGSYLEQHYEDGQLTLRIEQTADGTYYELRVEGADAYYQLEKRPDGTYIEFRSVNGQIQDYKEGTYDLDTAPATEATE